MRMWMRHAAVFILLGFSMGVFCAPGAAAQAGSTGTIKGTVTDPTGAVVPGAIVKIQNPVSQYARTATTDGQGDFQFINVPFDSYHLTAHASGFRPGVQDVQVKTAAPVTVTVKLNVSEASTTV